MYHSLRSKAVRYLFKNFKNKINNNCTILIGKVLCILFIFSIRFFRVFYFLIQSGENDDLKALFGYNFIFIYFQK